MKSNPWIFIVFLALACHQQKTAIISETENIKAAKLENSTGNDGNAIIGPVAVIVNPSQRLIAKVKKDNPDEGGYDTLLDDDVHYMSAPGHYLDSLKVKKIQRESEGYIAFKTTKGQVYKMKVDTMFFGILLFNGLDKPIEADIVDIQPDFEKYMLRTP